MKKIIILIPIFNDWKSFKKLIFEINENIKDIDDILFECIAINDASTENQPELKKPVNFYKLRIFNMKVNKGHARCNAFGIRYIIQNEEFDKLVLMDGDGEDRPVEIKSLIEKARENPENSIVAKRIKRSEGFLFRFLYFVHKLITFIFTGKKINFGNFSCLNRKDVELISTQASLWNSYSGTLKKYISGLVAINSIRGERYFGPSKMSLYNLIMHSFSIIAVFKYQVLIRSILIIIVLNYFEIYLGILSFLFQIFILIFCVIIFLISTREKKDEIINSQENLDNIKVITH